MIKPLAVSLAVASVVVSWGIPEDGSWLFFVVFGIWTVAPWAVLASDRVARDFEIGGGARFLALAGYVALSAAIYTGVDDSSTGAIGLLFLPFYLFCVYGGVLLGSRLFRRARAGS